MASRMQVRAVAATPEQEAVAAQTAATSEWEAIAARRAAATREQRKVQRAVARRGMAGPMLAPAVAAKPEQEALAA